MKEAREPNHFKEKYIFCKINSQKLLDFIKKYKK